jgi:nitroreductase
VQQGPLSRKPPGIQNLCSKGFCQEKALSLVSGGRGSPAQAPLVLVFCSDPEASASEYGERGKNLYCIQDATIAAAYCQLAATDAGLASVWIGSFDEEEVRRILGTDLRPVAIIPAGYAGEEPEPTTRKGLRELVKEL